MKTLKYFLLIALIVLSVMAMVSCLDSNDGDEADENRTTITEEEWESYLNMTNYTITQSFYNEGKITPYTTIKVANGFACQCDRADGEGTESAGEKTVTASNDTEQVENVLSSVSNDIVISSSWVTIYPDTFISSYFPNIFSGAISIIGPSISDDIFFSPKYVDSQGNTYTVPYDSPSPFYISGCSKEYNGQTYYYTELIDEKGNNVWKWALPNNFSFEKIDEIEYSHLTYDESLKAYYCCFEEFNAKMFYYFKNGKIERHFHKNA